MFANSKYFKVGQSISLVHESIDRVSNALEDYEKNQTVIERSDLDETQDKIVCTRHTTGKLRGTGFCISVSISSIIP